eukprot:gene9647-20050_t
MSNEKLSCLPSSVNMISIPSSATTTISEPQICTSRLVENCWTEVRLGPRNPSGKRMAHPDKMSKSTSPKSRMNSKCSISTANAEYLEDLSTRDTRNKRSSDEVIFSNDTINAEYVLASQKANNWEAYVNGRYDEEDVLTIMGMLSYLDNIERGFGDLNDQLLFESERESDVHGILYKEAVEGSKLTKKCIHLLEQLHKVQRKCLHKKSTRTLATGLMTSDRAYIHRMDWTKRTMMDMKPFKYVIITTCLRTISPHILTRLLDEANGQKLHSNPRQTNKLSINLMITIKQDQVVGGAIILQKKKSMPIANAFLRDLPSLVPTAL